MDKITAAHNAGGAVIGSSAGQDLLESTCEFEVLINWNLEWESVILTLRNKPGDSCLIEISSAGNPQK